MQHSLGETQGDVHANVIGGRVHFGSGSSAAVPAQQTQELFATASSFSVTGLSFATTRPLQMLVFSRFPEPGEVEPLGHF